MTCLEKDLFIPDREAVVVSARHATALKDAKKFIDEALDEMKRQKSSELIVSDLRAALDALGGITGKIDNEKVLDKLFSAFCIGK